MPRLNASSYLRAAGEWWRYLVGAGDTFLSHINKVREKSNSVHIHIDMNRQDENYKYSMH